MSPPRTIGAAASSAWAERRGLDVSHSPHWYVEITIPSDAPDTRFEINIYPEEWGVILRRGERVSSIRVTDVAFVHGHDEHRLFSHLPELENIEDLLRLVEQRFDLALYRMKAIVRSNLTRATAIVRPWLVRR